MGHEVWRVDALGRWTEVFDIEVPITSLRLENDEILGLTKTGESRLGRIE